MDDEFTPAMDHRHFWAELRDTFHPLGRFRLTVGQHPCAWDVDQVVSVGNALKDTARALEYRFPGLQACLPRPPDDAPVFLRVSLAFSAYYDLERASMAMAGHGAGLSAPVARAREQRLRAWYPWMTDERLDAWSEGPVARYRSPAFMAADAKQKLVRAYLNMDETGPRLVMRDRRAAAALKKPTMVPSLMIKDNGYMMVGRVTFRSQYTEWRSLSGALELMATPPYPATLPHERLDALKTAAIRAVLQHWDRQTPAQRAIFNKLLTDRAVCVPRKRARPMDKDRPAKRPRV